MVEMLLLTIEDCFLTLGFLVFTFYLTKMLLVLTVSKEKEEAPLDAKTRKATNRVPRAKKVDREYRDLEIQFYFSWAKGLEGTD